MTNVDELSPERVADLLAPFQRYMLPSTERMPVPEGFRFEAGKTYPTIGGRLVTVIAEKNEMRGYETVEGSDISEETPPGEKSHGVHRYNRSGLDMGRTTGTAHDFSCPLNILPVAVDI
jgi:hypothetical protein